jgi:acetyltransferase-like isoleucine patch superfamily enzyme
MTVYSKHTGEKSTGTFIKKSAFIGTAAVVGPNVTIGEGVVIGAQAYVSKDCVERGIYIGVPAKLLKRL